VLHNSTNRGKAESVRRGIVEAIAQGPGFVGYWDADFSTPLDEVPVFRSVLQRQPHLVCVLGSRVQRLGSRISRGATRHYLGRVFATLASLALKTPVYDTQCGAKLFRVSPWIESVFSQPFVSRWIFDVEILARLGRAACNAGSSLETIAWEEPLVRWREVPGSKLGLRSMANALLDLWRIRRSAHAAE
jgi:hypothetical protein